MIQLAELREWVFEQLNGAITGGVYSRVPTTATKPYTVIASQTSVPWDTETDEGSEDTVTLSLFDDGTAPSPVRIEGIMSQIDAILHGARVTLDGGEEGWMEREFADTYQETVGTSVTWRGILRYRAHISE